MALPSDGGAEARIPECPINALLHALSAGDKQHLHRHIRRDRTDVTACDLNLYMHSPFLRQTDWAGMAHSAKTRTPLVDGKLFCALATPLLSSEPLTKLDFVAVGALRLWSAVLTHPKTRFGVPIAPRLAQWAGRGSAGSRDWGKYVYRRATAPNTNV
jgi:asparagine synthase (glutamine-hydrolysing)